MSRPVTLSEFLERAEGPGFADATPEARPVMDRLKSLESGVHDASALRLNIPALGEGEQYRFHFDMTRCIGCRCCEVACNEQNGNDADVTWRRVGEIEGGTFPHVRRFHLSMACNHCLEPACLEGCPTSAYEKLPNGIVKHNADSCIGCQYCTWNCPYGVPQYNPKRRIVTKCHMCVDRMGGGNLPACVEACPVQAIQIEKVKVSEWREAIDAANAPGVPPADLTLSTTRITLPEDLPLDFGSTSPQRLEPEPAHWSLVYFLTASQASVGAALFSLLYALMGQRSLSGVLSVAAAVVGHAALAGTLFHLGRPIHAFKALRGYKKSWLSREVVAFTVYAGLVVVPANAHVLSWFGVDLPISEAALLAVQVLTAVSGLVGIYTSVRIYRIPARPAWDSRRTTASFFLTSLVLGSAGALLLAQVQNLPFEVSRLAALILSGSTLASALVPWMLALDGAGDEPSVRGAAQLMRQNFSALLTLRTGAAVLLAMGIVVWSFSASTSPRSELLILLVALCAAIEATGRYLFFRCVVPRNMPLGFFAQKPVH